MNKNMNKSQSTTFLNNRLQLAWVFALLALLGFMVMPTTEAATLYYAATNNSFGTGNWVTSPTGTTANTVALTAADDLVFNTTANNALNQSINLAAADKVANTLTFNSSGTTTLLRSTSTSASSSQKLTISTGITLATNAGAVVVATNDNKVALKLGDIAGNFNLTQNSSNSVTFNQIVGLTTSGANNRTLLVGGTGAGGVNFMGGLENGSTSTGVLALRVTNANTIVRIDAASTYSGGTILDAGTIALGSATALGTGSLTINGGAIAAVSSARTIANNITSGGDFKLGGQGQSLTLNGTLGLGGSTRTVTLGNSAILNGVISNGGLAVTGDGSTNLRTMTITASNTYTGTTSVSGASLVVSGNIASSSGTTVNNLGNLTVNGIAGGVTLNAGGSLLGSGSVGAVILNSGSFLKPGNSPGNLTASSAVWNSGATYEWQITSLTGTAGTNWDLFTVSGALNLSNLSSSAKFNLTLDSAGTLVGFNPTADYSWTFAKAASITGLTSTSAGTDITALFAIGSTSFNGGVVPTDGFKVIVGETSGGYTSLNLVPEPSAGALLGLGLAALVAVRSFRRRSV